MAKMMVNFLIGAGLTMGAVAIVWAVTLLVQGIRDRPVEGGSNKDSKQKQYQ